MPADELDVVVICSGNRFRSPIAEAVLRGATEGLPVRVRSYGTLDLASSQALPEALELGPSLGLDLAAHRSRRLAGEDLSAADLVIGFEPIHVSSAVVEAGAPRGRTFMLTELVERLEGVAPPTDVEPVERARALIEQADEARTGAPATPDEIADPIGGPAAGFRTSADRVASLTRRLAELLFG